MTATDERGQPIRGEAVEAEPKHRIVVGLLLTAGTAVALGAALLDIPRANAHLSEVARYALQVSLPSWNLTEPVNEVVYGTRGFDTFGETFLLLAAVVSVVLLSRPREPRTGYFGEDVAGKREQSEVDPSEKPGADEREARSAESGEMDEDSPAAGRSGTQRPKTPDNERVGGRGPERAEAMAVVVRGGVRAATPVLAVAGCYLVAWGYSPGGGFPGGAVVLGVVLLVYSAFGRGRIARVIKPSVVETAEMAGAALIILTEALGLALKGSFTANWLPLTPPGTIRSGGVVQLFSAGELVEVGTGLIIAVFALLAMSHDWARDTSSGEEGDEGDEGGGREGGAKQ
ncbi:sodium:proton antiporter [Actinocrinis puniceicyclus]|uniref:Sodium:proton antiporter n=1 Tax=Actinocrinis puniceicyclus TaxID=977794 RepID=A0A8J7WFX0_9ACTN|nr:MnhB domain-containing protein [Actinocrinis puniceicyclus]MBS2961421.1 sodium:proton antiporter [Actinocrinis puniceicyclus]